MKIDYRGIKCPVPLINLKKIIRNNHSIKKFETKFDLQIDIDDFKRLAKILNLDFCYDKNLQENYYLAFFSKP